MRKVLVPILGLIALAAVVCGTAGAQTVVDDPLHGYCAGAGQCVDNGTNSPTTTNPPASFGFTVSPGPASGDLLIEILTPNNEAGSSSYSITGTLTGTATQVTGIPPGPWSSGNLDAYLGISASPTNSIGAFLPSTQALDPGASGFNVFQADLGTTTLQDAANPGVSPLLNLGSDLPLASYVVAFLNEGTASAPNWIATANSGAIFETGPTPTPEPSSLLMLGAGLVGLAVLASRRSLTA